MKTVCQSGITRRDRTRIAPCNFYGSLLLFLSCTRQAMKTPCSAMKCLTSQLLLGIACFLVSPAMVAAQGSVETDHAALVALYDSTGGDNWTSNTNWKSDKPLYQWYGIETDNTGRVESIDLHGRGLTGSIPPEVGDLVHLKTIRLGGNNLTSSIPSEIENLIHLEILNIRFNELTGPIPPGIGNLVNLKEIELDVNDINGHIPSNIGNLVNLTRISLAQNELTGPMPPGIINLVNLKEIDLAANDISGNIPSGIGNLINLTSINLGNNELIDSIPLEISNLVNLTFFRLTDNQLTGPIPAEIGNLVNLTYLSMGSNLLSGPIPLEIGNLVHLTELYLGSNQLTGPIPSEIGNLVNMEKLSLGSNQLTGSLPPEMGNLVNLKTLILRSNQLTGEIPSEVCNILLIPQIVIRLQDNPGLINNCLQIPDEFVNNRRQIFEILQEDDPPTIKSAEFILIEENSYGRVWISSESFKILNISDESMDKFLTYIFSSIPADSTKGIFEYASNLLGKVRKNYVNGNNGERIVDMLCHVYDWKYLGLAHDYHSSINITRYNSSPSGPGDLVYSKVIAHEYVHNIHFAYGAYSENLPFFIEGLAEWATDNVMFDERDNVFTFPYNVSVTSFPGEPLFVSYPIHYERAKIFGTYLADRIGANNMKHLIQVCKPGGVCYPDDPDNGDWYQGIDGLEYALSSLDAPLTLLDMVVDYHTTNLVNDPTVLLNGVKYGYETPRYANKEIFPLHVVNVNFVDSTFSKKELEIHPGGFGYIAYENPSDLHLSFDKSHSDVTSLRLFKERNNTKELAEMDGDVTEYTVTGDYDRVTLIAVHNNPRPDQPEITLNISATQNYDPTAIEDEELPTALSLAQNYPNPFNPSTFIRWAQPQTGQVRLSVYNMLGQEVATLTDEVRPAGTHETRLDALGWTSGVYVYVLEAGEQTLTQKMILLK